jgi:hypothetical protein
MTIRIVPALAVLAVALSGCATVMKGSSETISINTIPGIRADCSLSNGRGIWRVSTPGRVTVKRSKRDMDVTCRAFGYEDAKGVISSDFQTWTLGNLLIGGVIGLAIDMSNGAINNYDHHFAIPVYPSNGYTTPGMRIPVPSS